MRKVASKWIYINDDKHLVKVFLADRSGYRGYVIKINKDYILWKRLVFQTEITGINQNYIELIRESVSRYRDYIYVGTRSTKLLSEWDAQFKIIL